MKMIKEGSPLNLTNIIGNRTLLWLLIVFSGLLSSVILWIWTEFVDPTMMSHGTLAERYFAAAKLVGVIGLGASVLLLIRKIITMKLRPVK